MKALATTTFVLIMSTTSAFAWEKDAQDRRQAWLIYVKPAGLGTNKQALALKLQHHD